MAEDEYLFRIKVDDASTEAIDKIEKKTTNYMQNLRKAELLIYRGTALLEGGIRIAEHLGVKVDQHIKDTINDVQMVTAFLASATIMATKLRAIVQSIGLGGVAAFGGVAAGGVAAGLGAGYVRESMGGTMGKYAAAMAGPSVGIAGFLFQLLGFNPWQRMREIG